MTPLSSELMILSTEFNEFLQNINSLDNGATVTLKRRVPFILLKFLILSLSKTLLIIKTPLLQTAQKVKRSKSLLLRDVLKLSRFFRLIIEGRRQYILIA